MTEIMSYTKAVLEIREEVANREHFIISGATKDMIMAMSGMEGRYCTVWINSGFDELGVYKINSSESETRVGIYSLLRAIVGLLPVELGIVVSVPKTEGLPDKFPRVVGKDLIYLNGSMALMAAEAFRTIWPDDTVLPPEETVEKVVG